MRIVIDALFRRVTIVLLVGFGLVLVLTRDLTPVASLAERVFVPSTRDVLAGLGFVVLGLLLDRLWGRQDEDVDDEDA